MALKSYQELFVGDEMNTHEKGKLSERAAGAYLEQKGYRIIQYNYRCKIGEIDLIAEDGDTIVFCEVKYRSSERYGTPLEAVGSVKQRKILRCAQYFLMEHGVRDRRCRFDVIGVSPDRISHIENAFYS